MRYVPGILGAALIVVGFAFISWPLAVIVAGVLLLGLDRRIR